jgi:hypothetical protein
MENQVNQTDTAYSLRSQRNLLEEDRFRGSLAEIEDHIGWIETEISKIEKDKAALLNSPPQRVDQSVLAMYLRDLEDKRRILATYKEQRTSVEDKIAKCPPSAGDLKARAKEQQRLAQLIAERLEKDRQANAALTSLRQALQERAGLTATMKKSVVALDFASDGDLLDAQRFDALVTSLPEDLLAGSQWWSTWFLGKEKGVKPYIVRDRLLAIPETLASHGVYRFGDRVELSKEQAKELMREDRPTPTQAAPWRCAPPSVMTIEAYEAADSLAEKTGITIQEVLMWGDFERDAKIMKRFTPPTIDGGPIPREDSGESVTVKVKAQGRIAADGRTYNEGDVFQLQSGKWDVCTIFQRGTIVRP